MFTKDKPELGREPDLGRRGNVSGALKRYFKITHNYKNMAMATVLILENLALHCAVIGAEGGPWEWTVNTSRFLQRAFWIEGIFC